MRLYVLIFSLAFSFTVAQAAYKSSFKPFKVKPAPSAKIPVKPWQKKVFPLLVNGVCEKQGYFVSCYKVSPKQCRLGAKIQLSSCQANMVFPKRFKDDYQALQWSHKVGQCLGKRLEKKWHVHRRSKPACSNKEAWL